MIRFEWKGSALPEVKEGFAIYEVAGQTFTLALTDFQVANRIHTILRLAEQSGADVGKLGVIHKVQETLSQCYKENF